MSCDDSVPLFTLHSVDYEPGNLEDMFEAEAILSLEDNSSSIDDPDLGIIVVYGWRHSYRELRGRAAIIKDANDANNA